MRLGRRGNVLTSRSRVRSSGDVSERGRAESTTVGGHGDGDTDGLNRSLAVTLATASWEGPRNTARERRGRASSQSWDSPIPGASRYTYTRRVDSNLGDAMSDDVAKLRLGTEWRCERSESSRRECETGDGRSGGG
jgi:hypothetical protein